MPLLWYRALLFLQGLAANGLRREEGQGLTEYALIIALIAVVVVGAILVLGQDIGKLFNNVSNCLSNNTSC